MKDFKKLFANYVFNASGVGNLMTNPRRKSDKLSQTTKAYLKEIYIKEVFGRERDTSNKYIEKGTWQEEDSLTLASDVLGVLMIKNKEKFSNEYVKGYPDVLLQKDKLVIDIKTAWDIFSFANVEEVKPLYYWQLQSYMYLTGYKKAKLVYTLVNAPEHLIVSEKSKRAYYDGLMGQEGTEAWDAMEEAVEKLMKYDDIDPKIRVKVFDVEYNQEDIDKMIARINDARDYLVELAKLQAL